MGWSESLAGPASSFVFPLLFLLVLLKEHWRVSPQVIVLPVRKLTREWYSPSGPKPRWREGFLSSKSVVKTRNFIASKPIFFSIKTPYEKELGVHLFLLNSFVSSRCLW